MKIFLIFIVIYNKLYNLGLKLYNCFKPSFIKNGVQFGTKTLVLKEKISFNSDDVKENQEK